MIDVSTILPNDKVFVKGIIGWTNKVSKETGWYNIQTITAYRYVETISESNLIVLNSGNTDIDLVVSANQIIRVDPQVKLLINSIHGYDNIFYEIDNVKKYFLFTFDKSINLDSFNSHVVNNHSKNIYVLKSEVDEKIMSSRFKNLEVGMIIRNKKTGVYGIITMINYRDYDFDVKIDEKNTLTYQTIDEWNVGEANLQI